MYEVPAAKKSTAQDKWSFKIGEKTHSVPKVKHLTGSQMEDLTSGNLTQIFNVFGERGTPVGDAVRSLQTDQIEALVAAWIADSGLTPGESKAS